MLGAGFVTRPTLDVLSEAGIPVTVGTSTVDYNTAPLVRQSETKIWAFRLTFALVCDSLPYSCLCSEAL